MRTATLVLALAFVVPFDAQETESWSRAWDAARRADQALETTDLSVLAAALAEAPGTRHGAELLYRLEVFVRAGHDARALAVLDELAAADPPLTWEITEVVDALVDREADALAVRALERFPDARPGRGHVLLRRRAAELGWEAADRWALERQPAAPEYWVRERLQFRREHGQAGALFAELVAGARSHPGDLARFLLLDQVRHLVEPAPDLGWMGSTFQPRSAFDAARFAREVGGPGAVALLESALAMPVSAEDLAVLREWVSANHSMAMFQRDDDAWRAWLRDSIRWSLVEAYRVAGMASQAQVLLQELARESSEQDGIPDIPLFVAGRVQSESGARVVEDAVIAAEEEQRDSPEYWSRRAAYYAGRGERGEELAAVERALAVTEWDESEPTTYVRRHGLVLHRARLLPGAAAFAFLRAEAASLPAASEYEGRLVYMIADHHAELVSADEPLFWRHLEAATAWSLTEERLLKVLAEKHAPEKRADFWARAERVAGAHAGGRVPVLAWVAHRQGEVLRAVRMLGPVLAQVPEGEARETAAVTLFEAGRDAGEWALAESAWPFARRTLGPHETAPWLAGLASAQARAGAADEALRTWAHAANLDRRELSALPDLVRAGLRPRLVAFYEDIAARDPAASELVGRVLATLAE